MKKIIYLLSLSFLGLNSFANEPISTSADDLKSEFKEVNKLESFVNENQGVTLEELKAEKNSLVSSINSSASSVSAIAGELPAGIPAFWWGCVLSWVGLLLVYILTDKDQGETKKALYGCLVNAGVWILYYVFIVAIAGRAFIF